MRRSWLFGLFLLAAAAVALYAYTFGPIENWQLSRQSEDWARFGEYLGGIFGMLAFIAVLGVISGQRRVLEQYRGQTTLEELLREARHLATTIESVLGSPVETVALTAQQLSALDKPSTVAGVLELVDPRVASEVGRPMPPGVEDKPRLRRCQVRERPGVVAGKADHLTPAVTGCRDEGVAAGHRQR